VLHARHGGIAKSRKPGCRAPRDDLDARFKNQYTLGLSWADPLLGGFSISYSHSCAI
jgi:hypothetical protein